jgi:hypothetical protein
MFKWLIAAVFFLYSLVSLAQSGVTEIPQLDSTGTLHHLFMPKPNNIISYDNYNKFNKQVKNINPKDSVPSPWPATWEEFKREFIEMKVEVPLANLELHLPSAKEMRNIAYPQGGIIVQGPISFLYDQFSKEARSKRIYADLMKKDAAAVRYNSVVVSKVTGIQDKEDIKKFIDFCALRVQFILDASDYELYAAIQDCYEDFCINEYDTLSPVPQERKTGW